MKKLAVVCLVLVFGAFTAGAVFANPSYSVQVTNSKVFAVENGVSGLPSGAPGTTVEGLNATFDPFVSSTGIVPLTSSFPGSNWDAAGWWEFKVTGSTGSDWNTVFGGGTWKFETQWTGTGASIGLNPYFAATNTFNNVYGKWYENNAHVWTYFGLYFPPNTGPASADTDPTGIFAFVAEKGAPSWSDGQFDALYGLIVANSGNAVSVTGTGIMTAAPVPVPPSVWLLGSGLIGLVGLRRRFTAFLKR